MIAPNLNAIVDAMGVHWTMNKHALNSDAIRARILTVLLGGILGGA